MISDHEKIADIEQASVRKLKKLREILKRKWKNRLSRERYILEINWINEKIRKKQEEHQETACLEAKKKMIRLMKEELKTGG